MISLIDKCIIILSYLGNFVYSQPSNSMLFKFQWSVDISANISSVFRSLSLQVSYMYLQLLSLFMLAFSFVDLFLSIYVMDHCVSIRHMHEGDPSPLEEPYKLFTPQPFLQPHLFFFPFLYYLEISSLCVCWLVWYQPDLSESYMRRRIQNRDCATMRMACNKLCRGIILMNDWCWRVSLQELGVQTVYKPWNGSQEAKSLLHGLHSSSYSGLLGWWTVRWNKLFPPKLFLVIVLYHSNRKLN